jgi:hypothetical protein
MKLCLSLLAVVLMLPLLLAVISLPQQGNLQRILVQGWGRRRLLGRCWSVLMRVLRGV